MDTHELDVMRDQFIKHIKRRFPELKILKVADLLLGNFVAIVQEGDGKPFIIGKRHGHLVPVKIGVLEQAKEHHTIALNDVLDALDILHAYVFNDPEKWKTLLNTLGGDTPTD